MTQIKKKYIQMTENKHKAGTLWDHANLRKWRGDKERLQICFVTVTDMY